MRSEHSWHSHWPPASFSGITPAFSEPRLSPELDMRTEGRLVRLSRWDKVGHVLCGCEQSRERRTAKGASKTHQRQVHARLFEPFDRIT